MRTACFLALVLLTRTLDAAPPDAPADKASGGASPPSVTLTLPPNVDPEKVKDLGTKAMESMLRAFSKAPQLAGGNAPRRFAILPLQRDIDNGYFTLQLRNLFTTVCVAGGFELYTPRSETEFNSLLDEIKWGQMFEDTMDQATVQKFGRIQGVQGLIHGRVDSISLSPENELKVRVMVQAFVVETGRQIWGKQETATLELPKNFKFGAEHLKYVWMALGALVVFVVLIMTVGAIRRAARPR